MTRLVDARTDQFVEDLAVLDPLTATYAGIPGHDGELPDLSPEGFEAREELHRRALREVAGLATADEREEVAKNAFLERVGLAVERADAGVERSEFSVISSAAHAVREIFDLMPTRTAEHWDAIGDRLAAVPAALDGYRTTLLEEAAAGRLSARRQYAEVAAQVRGWTGQEGAAGDYFLRAVAGAPEPARAALTRAAERAS
ncbi:MAG TPA: DUF885 family protein, partial [Nocardioides sp.]|nr:DUF885 family protein [Nocardioides sp.]